MPQAEWDEILKEASANADVQSMPEEKKKCGSCQNAASVASGEWLKEMEAKDDKIRIVREIADKSPTVVEFQSTRNVLTATVMASKAGQLYSNTKDVADRLVGHRSRHKQGLMMTLGKGSPEDTEPRRCDLLLIGDLDVAATTGALVKHGPLSNRWAIVYGRPPFIAESVRNFLKDHPEWTVIQSSHARDCLVLSKSDEDKMKPPPLSWKQIWNYGKAVAKNAAQGFGSVSEDVLEERLKICTMCPFRKDRKCGQCGCPIERKASFPQEKCPVGHWHAVE
jgi:hypothetical protein